MKIHEIICEILNNIIIKCQVSKIFLRLWSKNYGEVFILILIKNNYSILFLINFSHDSTCKNFVLKLL